MAVSLKNGWLIDSVSGKSVGLSRNQGESDESYISRGTSSLGSAVNSYGSGLSNGSTAYNPERSAQLVDNKAAELKAYQDQILQAQQIAKQAALKSAYENNSQSLNSQNSTVNNAYSSAVNSINATKEAQLPQYQQQRNAASADAAQTARKVRELMAATGRYNSGTNRSQQLAVDLNRQNAIQGLNQGENQFTTQIANQLSEADNNKASATSDIASKLALLQRQYNDGTLSLTNQMESEKAAAASKAMIDAQNWADATQQRGVDNSFRQGQFDYQKTLDGWNQDFQSQKYGGDQALQLAQLMGSYNGSPTLASQQMTADQAYKASGGSGGTGGGTATERKQTAYGDALSKVQDWVSEGYTPEQIQNILYQNASDFARAGLDIDELGKMAYNMYQNSRANSGGHNVQ